MSNFERFTPEEAAEVSRALAAVAAADGALKAREINFLDGFATAYEIGGHLDFNDPLDDARLAAVVKSMEARRQVIRTCLTMALSDGHFADQECFMIERICRAFGIADDELDRMIAIQRANPR